MGTATRALVRCYVTDFLVEGEEAHGSASMLLDHIGRSVNVSVIAVGPVLLSSSSAQQTRQADLDTKQTRARDQHNER